MATLFEQTMNQQTLNSLQDLKNSLIAESERKKQEEREEMEREHRAVHIFSTYEEALDWLVANPGEGISWHCSTIYWDKKEGKFLSYEQDYSFDGVMCYDVRRYYTKEQLLQRVKEHQDWIAELHPEEKDKQWWLDEWGKLKYVSILKNDTLWDLV